MAKSGGLAKDSSPRLQTSSKAGSVAAEVASAAANGMAEILW
jgi:hypothetical protein